MTWQLIGLGLAGIAAIAGAVKIWLMLVRDRQMREVGRTQARLEAAEREAKRAKARTRIDEAVGRLGPDDLERELRENARSGD